MAAMFKQTLNEQAFFLLDIKGQGPLTSTRTSKVKAGLFLIFECITGVLLILGMVFSAEDFYDALANVTALATLNQAVTKGVVLLLHRDHFIEGINCLTYFWPPDKFGDGSNKIIFGYQLFIRRVLRMFRIVIVITATLYLSKPLLEGKRILPMLCFTICDTRNDTCYVFHYIFLVASLATQLITLVGFDGVFFTLLMCAYSELEQIKFAFQNLNMTEHANGQELLKQGAAIVEHHNLVLQYIRRCDELFQLTLLSQFATTIFSYCSGLFILTASGFPPSTGEFLRSGPYVASVFFQILIYCAVGEKIAEQGLPIQTCFNALLKSYLLICLSILFLKQFPNNWKESEKRANFLERFSLFLGLSHRQPADVTEIGMCGLGTFPSDVVYETKWSACYQPKFRKILLLVMQRAQKRSQITAGRVWNLNMSTFASILKGSMSMLAFMQTVYRNTE